jgi:outer membrane protein OmpA-like peptidoglycan-associated protein
VEPKAGGVRTVATINFPSATANFTQADRGAIDRIAAQFQQKPGTVHITAYAAGASSGRSQLDAYRDALDRGQAVAKALAGDGVPIGKIQTEAAPSHEGAAAGRVVIQLAP